MIRRSLGTVAVAAILAGPAAAQERITIGYDGSDAVRPLALALCRAVSEGTDYRCVARRGAVDSGSGAPLLFIAYADMVGADARAVVPLRIEPVAIVTRSDAGIGDFSDLAATRVNIGAEGTTERTVMDALIADAGWTTDTFSLATGLDTARQTDALCDNQLDAGVAVPDMSHRQAASVAHLDECEIVPVEIATEAAGFARATVPAGAFANEADIATVGRSLELVTLADTDADTVHAVTQAIVSKLDSYSAFEGVDATRLAEGVVLPLHDGAIRYHTPPQPAESDAATDDGADAESGADSEPSD